MNNRSLFNTYVVIKNDYKRLTNYYCDSIEITGGGDKDIPRHVEDFSIDDLITIERLGTGVHGNVYKVYLKTQPDIPFALKIEYLLESDNMKDTSSKMVRAVRFDQDVSSINDRFFLRMLKYDIKDDCQEPKTQKQIQTEKKYNEIKSNRCLRMVYDLIDGTLNSSMISSMNNKELGSMTAQIILCLYLMHNKGYSHCDVNSKNIGFIITNDKSITVEIDNHFITVPIYGKRFILIDYGNILHDDFIMTEYEKKKIELHKNMKELDHVFFGYVLSNGENLIKCTDIDSLHKKLGSEPEMKDIELITDDRMHQIAYYNIIKNKTNDNTRIKNIQLLYIKLKDNLPALIERLIKGDF